MKENEFSFSGANEAKKFLEVLYGEEEVETGYLVCFTLPKHRVSWFWNGNKSEFVKYAMQEVKHSNVYVGMGLQNKELALKVAEKQGKIPDESRIRGYKKTVSAIPGVWLDVDVKGPAHKADNLPETFEDANKIIEKFSLSPTMIVHSGYGYQAYWLLKEPWLLESDEERNEAQEFLDTFQKTMQYHASGFGWRVDPTADLTRVLRVPGTMNRKEGIEHKPVKIVHLEENNRYTIDDFEQYFLDKNELKKVSPSKSTSSNKTIEVPPTNQFAKIEYIEEGCTWMRHCKEDAKTLSEPEWYASLTILGRCIKGENLAHEWSSPYSGYSYKETEQKLAQALNKTGPITCEKVHGMTNGQWCKQCPFYNQIKSPIAISNIKEKEQQLEGAKQLIMKRISQSPNQPVTLRKTEKAALQFIKKEDPNSFEELTTALNLALNEKSKNTTTSSNRSHLRIAGKEESPQLQTVDSCLENSPGQTLLIPENYHLTEHGTYKITPKGNKSDLVDIAFSPILVTGLMKDIQTNAEMVQLSWKRGERWYKKIVNRDEVANARKIVDLAIVGFPVTTSTAKEVVNYISTTEAINYNVLPKQFVSSQLGWQGKNFDKGFLWGKYTILDGELKEPINENEISNSSHVIFRGAEAGDEQLVSGFHKRGTIEDWINAVKPASNYPKAMLGFYSAFVPPLLEILNCSNFIIDFANRTSTGKTTVQRIAASVAGNPDEKSPESILGTWDVTQVWLERASGVMSGLPVILDDTKRAKNTKIVGNILYTVASGRGRGRGNKKGINATTTWRTVLISSGETPATSFTTDGGTRARVLEVRGLPFVNDDEETREMVQEINREVCLNYGHALPLFVQWIQKNRDHWEKWQKEYQELTKYFATGIKNNVAGRLAAYASIIEITAILVHQAFKEMGHPLPWEYGKYMQIEWPYIAEEAEDPTGEEEAFREIVSWAYSRETHFYGRHQEDYHGKPVPPNSGWIGRWDKKDNWDYIAFYPNVLKNELERNGYNPNEILSLWNERGWLDTHRTRKGFTKNLRIEGKKQWVVMIKRAAIDSLN